MRDYLNDMNDLLDTKVPDSNYIPSLVSAEIVEWLRDNDPDLLHGWLNEIAVVVMTDVIGTRDRSDRARRRHHASAVAFSAAAGSFSTTGDPTVFSPFRQKFTVNDANLRRSVADMTSDDHKFVAAKYASSSKIADLESKFHAAIAKKIGPGQTTSDVMDESTYQTMYNSIHGRTT